MNNRQFAGGKSWRKLRRNTDPDTSDTAAKMAAPVQSNHWRRIMETLAQHPGGLTSAEIGRLSGLNYHATARRMRELADVGKIVDSGERRKTPSNRPAAVWRAVL